LANNSGGGIEEREGWSSFTNKLELEEALGGGGGGGTGLEPTRTVTQKSEHGGPAEEEEGQEQEVGFVTFVFT